MNLFECTAVEEMMHVEKVAERILFPKGEVEMKSMRDVQKIHDVRKMLEMAAGMETGSVKDYNEWANECLKTPVQLPKRFSEHWSIMKNVIKTNLTRKWKAL